MDTDELQARQLPASCLVERRTFVLPTDSNPVSNDDWDLGRLNKSHDRLRLAGQPYPARPLHHQLVLNRKIILSERIDLHLLWGSGCIYLKPLPRYLLPRAGYEQTLNTVRCSPGCCCPADTYHPDVDEGKFCDEAKTRRAVRGLLQTYIALIRVVIDMEIAQDNRLLPEDLKWSEWRELVAEVLNDCESVKDINKRFWYGELRLHRLNSIYRFLCYDFIRAYHSPYDGYSDFLRTQFSWLAAILVYIALALTAMQVGLATESLNRNGSFQRISVGLTAFSMLAPLALAGLVLGLFFMMLIGNWRWTSKSAKKRLDEMGLVNVDISEAGTRTDSTNAEQGFSHRGPKAPK